MRNEFKTFNGISVKDEFARESNTCVLHQKLNVAMPRHFYEINSTPTPSFCQSCAVDDLYYYMFFMNPEDENNIIIKKYLKTTGALINEVTIAGGYHCNAACVVGNMLYVVSLRNTILEINKTTMALLKIHNTIVNFRSISFYNGEFYGESATVLYKINFETGETPKVCDLKFPYVPSNFQGGAVYNGFLYEVGFHEKAILKFDIETGEHLYTYKIDDYYGSAFTGEIEGVSINEHGFYLCSATYHSFDNYRTGRLFEFNLKENESINSLYLGGCSVGHSDYYVGENTNGNPDGTKNNPFPSISQALQAICTPYGVSQKVVFIKLLKDCDEIIYARDNYIRVIGNGHSVYGANISGGCCFFENVVFKDGAGESNSNLFYANSSNIIFATVKFENIHSSREYAGNLSQCIFKCVLSEYPEKPINTYRCTVGANYNDRKYIKMDGFSFINSLYTIGSTLTPGELSNLAVASKIQTRCNVAFSGKTYVFECVFSPTEKTAQVNQHVFYHNNTEYVVEITQTIDTKINYTTKLTKANAVTTDGTVNITRCEIVAPN